MDQRTTYLLQILDKIGAPLMAAIIEAAPADSTPGQDAQMMAALLGKTVQTSIDLGQVMESNPAQGLDDSQRVALAALAGPLVAGQYKKRSQIPDEAGLKRIVTSLQAVLTFSDNFAPSPESIARLKELESRGQAVDTSQTQLQYVQAFIPVVEAISEFPFGQSEQKVMMEVSDRLTKKSIELREILFPSLQEEGLQKRAELGLLKALALLYSTTHRAETEKVMKMGDAGRDANLSMAPVWQVFELRAAMLETLASHLLPLSAQSGQAAPTPVTASQSLAAPEVSTVAAAPASAPVSSPAAGVNPMAMFSKPKTDQAPASPPPAPPLPEDSAPAAPPPPPVPLEQKTEDSGEQQGSQSGGGSPMSFFKKSE